MNKRKDSNPFVTRGRLKFRLCQILINAVALLVIAGECGSEWFVCLPRFTVGCFGDESEEIKISLMTRVARLYFSFRSGGLAAYFNAYPRVKYLNKTYVLPPATLQTPPPSLLLSPTSETSVQSGVVNPAPGVCLPIIVKFCQLQNVPYNFTIYPNYIGNFGQLEAQTVSERNLFFIYLFTQSHFLALIL